MIKEPPKRILVIGLTERMGGVETFIYNSTIFSDREKYEYDFLVHGTDHCVFENEILQFYNNERHIYFVEKIKKNPIKWLKDMLTFYQTNGSKYDYIHIQTGAASEIVYVFPFCFFYGIKVIVHSHNGNGYSPFINAVFRPIVNWVAYEKIACSVEAAKWLFGLDIKKVKILNNGIDTKKFSYNEQSRKKIRREYHILDELVIGHIGRFSEQKNHEKIIAIFREIKKRIENAKLILVGTGEKIDEIKELVKKIGYEKSIIFAGKQMNTEEYYSAFDVFLMPSLYEGLPIVGIEAQSMGLQCYFSNTIDKQILITDRAKIVSLDATDKEWADIICNNLISLNDREKYPAIVDQRGYSIRNTIKELENVYEV
ncbi:glycosyltransferase [Kineothrix sp. MSJ-39]|uniref:glycosyltransferase n=1 Tax=Kineothrix sp. MSJ-39 TaxID=2841533 RepID=UPI001C105B91|nr:glycosyltransferase [Kineothrix sp. MSJ-39]MBU5428789.1 glycosyltransferase [Kineothrix sp. MSJ-39]